MRVLLIKTSSLGDVIHTLPALTDAARALPGIRFDWVVEEGFAELPAWHPAVDRVIPVALRRWRRQPWQAWRSGEWSRFTRRLGETRYALAIDAQGLLKSAWLTRYVQAPVAGLDRDSIREPLASRFYQRRIPVARQQHAVERTRQLFARALDYPLPEGDGDYGLEPARLLASAQPVLPDGGPYVLFLHGTTWPSKHWPEADWRRLAEHLAGTGVAVWLPWGTAEEQARAGRIAAGLPGARVLPRLNLAGIAAVIAGAQACVAVDTGLGHLAAALGVPSLSLYGPTRPGLVGAYGRGQRHLCAEGPHAGLGDRHAACFDSLPAERVAPLLDQLLHGEAPA